MAWTPDQLKAINKRGGKILVSAAAGSGKTAVLSQRVLKYIKDGYDIDRLLVVTFTSLAALEMKTRIKESISKALIEDEKNEHLKKQLTLIDNAKITTMDAFYNSLVKQNFEKLKINPNFSILTSSEEEILKNKVIKEVLEQSFLMEDFNDLLDVLNANSTDLIKDHVFLLSNFLDNTLSEDNYLKEIIDKYDSNYYKELYFDDLKEKLTSFKKLYDGVSKELLNESYSFDKLSLNIKEEKNLIDMLLKIDSFDELSKMLRVFKFSNQARITAFNDNYYFNKYKTIRKNFKNFITKDLKPIYNLTDEDFKNQNKTLIKAIKTLFKVTLNYNEELLKIKNKINKYSYQDISKFALKLLIKDGNKTSLSREISDKFDEILIDEYQDTNFIQSVIFSAISKDDTNLFTVGDIKQSIYGFRGAMPQIFNNDKNKSSKDKFPMLITLSKNFRSRNYVLDFCNFIFESIMSKKIGQVSYDADEKLYQGACFEENKKALAEVYIINEEEKDLNVSKEEKEALFVSLKIKELIDNKYQVYDKKGYFRCIKPSDIAILSRSLSNSSYYVDYLNKNNISSYCDKDLNYFDNYDVKLIISILKLTDNFFDEISLVSVLKSKLFNVSDEVLATLKTDNKKTNLYDLIRKNGDEKLNDILNLFQEFNKYSNKSSIKDTISYIYKRLDIINLLALNKRKLKNLYIMIKNAADYENGNIKSFHEFICFIDEILDNKSSFSGINPLSNGDNVLITTIHKSKGLEYPVVFVCGCGKEFNTNDLKSDFLISNDYGMSFDVTDKDKIYKYEPLSKHIIKEKIKLSLLSEELRVLYVAFTRAREKLIITGYSKDLDKKINNISYMMGEEKSIDISYLKKCNSYLNWLLPCFLKHKDGKVLRDLNESYNKVFSYDSTFKLSIINSKSLVVDNFLVAKEKRGNTHDVKIKKYDYLLSKTPKYLSVSSLKNINHEFIKKPYFLDNDYKKTNVGTLYHKILELLPIKKYNVKSLQEELNFMVVKNKINKSDLKLISLDNLFSYLTSELYSIMLSSSKVYKELEINFKCDSSYYDISLKGGNIIVSGVIDLLFIKDDCYYLVDYKTDNVSTLNELKDLYNTQLLLYEEALKDKFGAKKIKKYIYSIKLCKFIEV